MLAATAVVLGASTVPAEATLPGRNGKIAFVTGIPDAQDFDYEYEIFVADPDGSDVTQLTFKEGEQPTDNYDPRWSPDGTGIAYWGLHHGTFDIFTMNADGGGKRQLTNGSETGQWSRDPAWSPDGDRLIYSSFAAGGGPQSVYIIDADGGAPRRLFTLSQFQFISRFEWSRHGRTVVSTLSSSGFGSDIVGIDPIIGEMTNLTASNPYSDADPSWSPDGRRILFMRQPEVGTGAEIHVMNRDGSDIRQLTDKGSEEFDPDWSPDGRLIAFVSDQGAQQHPNFEDRFHLVSMSPDETPLATISRARTGYRYPLWSPDSKRIAVVDDRRDGSRWVFLMFEAASGERGFVGTDYFRSGHPPLIAMDWQSLSQPPVCSEVRASASSLSPANHQFRLVEIQGATDPDGDPVTLRINSVTQDEPVTARGDRTAPDARKVPASNQVELRSERNPKGDGRVYRIGFTASDNRSRSCSDEIVVGVPRRKTELAVDSAPPTYSSFAP